MNLTISPAPVRKSVQVKAPPQKAFDVFTAGMGRWWLKSHSINNGVPMADVIMEPFAGGRWFERGEDGSECPWGKVLIWEPPTRLLLAWQTDGTWKHNPDFMTEVEVLFTPDGDGTRVDLEHRNLERFGEHAQKVRAAFESPGGWSGLLQSYAGVAAKGETL
jgi:uncharacterized protein YndB with AHSA1/START domain